MVNKASYHTPQSKQTVILRSAVRTKTLKIHLAKYHLNTQINYIPVS